MGKSNIFSSFHDHKTVKHSVQLYIKFVYWEYKYLNKRTTYKVNRVARWVKRSLYNKQIRDSSPVYCHLGGYPGFLTD